MGILEATEKKKKLNSARYISRAISIVCVAAYSFLMFRLFYLQNIHASAHDIFDSDMEAYLLTMQGKESGFDFPYPIYFWTGRFFMLFTNVEIAGAIATMLLNSLGVVALAFFMQKELQPYYEKVKLENYGELFSTVCSIAIFFVSMLFAPKGIYLPGMTHKYLGVFSPNPYHNATYMATRPFAIVAFFLFVRILDYYEERTDLKEFGLFSLFLFLTTITKPSFTLILVSTAGLLMAGRLILTKFKTFPQAFKLGLMFVPTFAALLYQFGGVFGKNSLAGEEGGIGFGFAAVWKVHMENIPFAIVLALAFPGLLLLLNLKELKGNTLFRFSWMLLIVSLLEFLLLYEKGDRFVHANFSWGYMHGIFFVFVSSIILLMQNTFVKRQKWYFLAAEWLAFGWHVGCGIVYFLYIWSGQFYYCF